MRHLTEIAANRDSVATIVGLTGAFEGIASMRIAQIKDQVQQSSEFFAQLWRIYNQIRVDALFHFGRRQSVEQVINKELMILITAEGGFSGDIDERLVREALTHHKPEQNDIIVIGHHGLVLLQQRGIRPKRSFQLPKRDRNITAEPLIDEVQRYESTIVYFQSYQSLASQDIKTIKLATAVAERGKAVEVGEEVISESNYIFEPSTFAVVDHLERSMMQITLSEVILESKLAQYASRFRAMSVAKERADESLQDLTSQYMRAKRHIKDERLKEIINGLRGASL
ncbi:MAG TPA: F0F1 ATP synthase subunit gamma [Candidatus Saccharimonadales bacterium]|nr:F0F1 ATP synthase subunit gamma [Candidatus Saccharimonadales bacterium]